MSLSFLQKFHHFHSMVCSPNTAHKCITAFKSNRGCILFMPYSYLDEIDDIVKYDASISTNLLSYYLLVISSFTGISTLLGLTDTVDKFETDIDVWPLKRRKPDEFESSILKSKLDPRMEICDDVFKYIENEIFQDWGRDENEAPIFTLKRKFEYRFRLVGLNVIMVHFESLYAEETRLHLVEVYFVKNRFLRACFKVLFETLGNFVNSIFGTRVQAKGKSK